VQHCSDPYSIGRKRSNESCSELAASVRLAEAECLDGGEVWPDSVVLWSEFFDAGEIPAVSVDDATGEECVVESRHESALTVRLADAVKSSGKMKTKRDRKRKRHHSEVTSNDDQPFATSSATSKTSSVTSKRRGKGAAIYIDRPHSICTTSLLSTSTDKGDDDVTAGNG